MNIFYAIACFAITLFCAVAAINTVFGLIGHTITLASWCIENSGELLIVGVLVYVVYERCFKKD